MSQGLNSPDFVPDKKRMPLWLKLGLGCGTLCILSCLGVCGGGAWWIKSTVDEFTQKYEAKGYKKVSAQTLTVSDPVDESTVFVAQQLNISGDVNADTAILAQICEITGTVNGDMDVMGQIIHVKKGAVINGDIRVESAQVVIIEGALTGEVSGSYQMLDDRRENQNDDADDVEDDENVEADADSSESPAPVEEEAAEAEPAAA